MRGIRTGWCSWVSCSRIRKICSAAPIRWTMTWSSPGTASMSRWRALASPNWSRAASSWPESWLSARSPAGERGSLSYWLEILWKVYVPLAKPTYLAYGLVSISHHWNNFIRPL
ncbi:hypothetical protein HALA3H3_510078 [Halomonas sp. A3H3]|nr:conserved hypothetical protein [Halomonas sp. 113]CAD5271958.1 conserved hypothetical protein [Halomonas sp. I3]CAD5290664.1 conserved hypothetical protein [Halomonas sp. 156]CDG53474.1 hypothetical protein HALA3H3_510078 [Halomonas sp. A3H3]VXB27115.1 conserved hypothetical protein [Halomonas titanicae]